MKDLLIKWQKDIEAIGSMGLMINRRDEIREKLERRVNALHNEITGAIIDEELKEGRTYSRKL